MDHPDNSTPSYEPFPSLLLEECTAVHVTNIVCAGVVGYADTVIQLTHILVEKMRNKKIIRNHPKILLIDYSQPNMKDTQLYII